MSLKFKTEAAGVYSAQYGDTTFYVREVMGDANHFAVYCVCEEDGDGEPELIGETYTLDYAISIANDAI